MLPPAPPVQMPQLNWSYFKPEFSGKPEEDAEAHLLRTNDWVETQNFPWVAKVQRFCFTLPGEARLWHDITLSLVMGTDDNNTGHLLTFSAFALKLVTNIDSFASILVFAMPM